MKNRKQLFMTSRLLLIIVAVALVLSMGLTACGLPSGTPNGKTPDVADSGNAGEDQAAQSLTTTSRVNLDETYGELLPLYETLTEQEGSSYSLAFNLAGAVDTADFSGAIDLRYVVTVADNGAISMMFLDENDNVLFSYKDGKISLDGFGMDIGLYQYNLEVDQLPSYPPDAAGCIMDILAFLNGFLSDYDTLAQMLPVIFDSMGFDTTGLVMTSQDGEYVFNANCQPLLILASAYLSDSFDDLLTSLPFEIDIASLLGAENTEASDLELLITTVDNMIFDGALMNGYIDINALLTITEKGLNASVALVNAADHTQQYLYFEIGARIEDEIPIEVPEVTALHDIQADIPISLPRTGIDMTIHAIFHTADIFEDAGHDIVTATVDLNGLEDVASLVLNDNYLYVDINELVMITNPLVGETTDYTYVFNFGSEKQFHTILRDISGFLDVIMEDIGFYDEYDDDNFLQLDLVVMDDINENMTEAELREKLYVSAVYNNRSPEELFDYRLAGCGCCPTHGSWVMVYYDYHDRYTSWEENNYDTYLGLDTLNVDWRRREIYQGMSESALRETLTVRIGDQEIYDYVIDDFRVCSYCGVYHIAVSYDGLSFSRYGRVLDCSGTYNHIGDGTGTNYISNTYSHQLLVEENIDPDEYICHGVIYDPKSFYNGITESEVHDLVHLVKITYGNPPEEIPDFEIEDINVTGNRLHFIIFHWDYDENNVPVSGYGFSIDATIYDSSVVSPLLPYLRFEVSPAQEPIDAISEVIGGLIGTYLENQDMLGDIIQVEDIENGKDITICLSDSTLVDSDVLSFINTFFGMPGENGLVDIDGDALYSILHGSLGENGIEALETVGGFSLEDLCNDLYLNVTGYLNNNNKLRFGFSLSGADNDPEVDETYLSIGIIEYHAVVTDSAYDANLTAEELAAANPINEIVAVLLDCFDKLRPASGNLE